MIFDARIPQPFSEPNGWTPIPADATAIILSLPVAASSGGTLARFFEAAIDSGKQIYWHWPEAWFEHANDFKRMLIMDEARSWLTRNESSQAAVSSGFVETFCQEFSFPHDRIAAIKVPPEPSLQEWLKATFANTVSQVNELEWHRLAKSFESQLGGFVPGAWQSLGFFPGFLRKEAPQLSERAALDWARVAASYSPINIGDSSGNGLVVNPTLQSVKVENQSLLAIARRRNDSLAERVLNWREAALIDELNEQPKISREAVIAAVSSELRGAESKLGQTVSWDEALGTLVNEEFILRI